MRAPGGENLSGSCIAPCGHTSHDQAPDKVWVLSSKGQREPAAEGEASEVEGLDGELGRAESSDKSGEVANMSSHVEAIRFALVRRALSAGIE